MADESNSNSQPKTERPTSLTHERNTGRKPDTVTIKGTASGLLIRLRDDQSVNFGDLLTELSFRLQSAEKFFRGAHTSIDLGRRELEAHELEALQQVLRRYDVQLENIVSGANMTRSAARQAGIEFKLPDHRNTRPPVPDFGGLSRESESGGLGVPFDTAEALFLRRTLRSGQIVRHHSDVCLLGDVNPGAEIIAGGDVIVWGSLRGAVQAGALKSSERGKGAGNGAVVCALQLSPLQLAIGDLKTHAPEEAGNAAPSRGPEIAYVQNEQIIVEPWFPGKKILRGAN